jgi:hypothetical protein
MEAGILGRRQRRHRSNPWVDHQAIASGRSKGSIVQGVFGGPDAQGNLAMSKADVAYSASVTANIALNHSVQDIKFDGQGMLRAFGIDEVFSRRRWSLPSRRRMTKESAAKYPCWWPRRDSRSGGFTRLPAAARAQLILTSARRSQPGFLPPRCPRDALHRRCRTAHAFQIGKLTGIYRHHPRLRCIILRPPPFERQP